MEPLTRYYKRHDTGEPVRVQVISEATGQPVNLNGVSVKFIMYQINDDGTQTEIVNAAAAVETPEANGIVRYDWSAGDTAVIGSHLAEFELTFIGGRKETYPRKGYLEINIEVDLDDN